MHKPSLINKPPPFPINHETKQAFIFRNSNWNDNAETLRETVGKLFDIDPSPPLENEFNRKVGGGGGGVAFDLRYNEVPGI